jgi:aubergine-like protein
VVCGCLNAVLFEWRCQIYVLYLISFQNLFTKAIAGCIVLTDYNNQTYRVDDVDFEVTPRSTFEIRRRDTVTKISFVEYYLRVSNVFWIDLDCLDFCA